jgi:Ala-tRNA(Pro) deacylase
MPLPQPTAHPAALSARMGTGRGGIHFAPEEAVEKVLGVPLGSVTPLALSAPSAAGVGVLLDHNLRGAPRIFVHPLVNTATTVVSAEGLETFLRWVGGWVGSGWLTD